jgi:hypothetical protein
MMNRTRVRAGSYLLALVASCFLPALASAQDVIMTSTPDKWQFSVLAYGWIPTIKGTVSFPIANSGGDFTADPNDIFNNLKMGFMGSFGVSYNRWGLFADVLYMDLGNSKSGEKDFTLPNQEPGNLTARINLDIKAWIVTSAVTYKLVEQPDFVMSSLVGMRYFNLAASLDWYFSADLVNNPGIGRAGGREVSNHFVDAIVGFKGQWMFGPNNAWSLPFYADIGGGDSKLTWQLAGGVAYHIGSWEVGALYRKINYHVDVTHLPDISIEGPMIGGLYRW